MRHGQTSWNKSDRFQGQNQVALNDEGVQQAQRVAQTLKTMHPSFLYASPLLRARQTADIIGRSCALPVTHLGGLMELDLGELDGITGEEMRARYPDVYQMWGRDPSQVRMPGGESLQQLQDRVWAQVESIGASHAGDDVVAVSHNFAIVAALCRLLDMPLSRFHRLRVDLGSMSTVELVPRGWRVISLNAGVHLNANSPTED